MSTNGCGFITALTRLMCSWFRDRTSQVGVKVQKDRQWDVDFISGDIYQSGVGNLPQISSEEDEGPSCNGNENGQCPTVC